MSVRGTTTEDAKGLKLDAGKPDQSFLPRVALEGAAVVFDYGAKKYARDNWRGGMHWTRPFGAILRHLWAWLEGEDTDPESGLHHLDHALCTLMMLRWFVAERPDLDDRFNGEVTEVTPEQARENLK